MIKVCLNFNWEISIHSLKCEDNVGYADAAPNADIVMGYSHHITTLPLQAIVSSAAKDFNRQFQSKKDICLIICIDIRQ